MLKIEVDKAGAQILHDGNAIGVAVELGIVAGNIYQALKSEDPQNAELFRAALQMIVKENDSPVWEAEEGQTVVRMPSMKKGGAPTDQS